MKKTVRTGILLALGCAAAAILVLALFSANLPTENTQEAVSVNASPAYSAEEFRTQRQQLRAMQKAQINEIIYGSSDPEIVAQAQRQLLDMLRREEQEGVLEGLITLRGFEGVVAAIQKDSASIFVRAELLTAQESGMILDLACRETGFLSGNIKIIPVN